MRSGFKDLRYMNQKKHFSFSLAYILTEISLSFLIIFQLKKEILRDSYSVANSKASQESSGPEKKNIRELRKRQKGQEKQSVVWRGSRASLTPTWSHLPQSGKVSAPVSQSRRQSSLWWLIGSTVPCCFCH